MSSWTYVGSGALLVGPLDRAGDQASEAVRRCCCQHLPGGPGVLRLGGPGPLDYTKQDTREAALNYGTRLTEAARVARQMIDAGEIGDVRMIETWRGLPGGWSLPEGTWASDPNEGSSFLDWGSHGCDIVRWYAGAEPTLAFGQDAKFDATAQIWATTMAHYSFANGVLAQIWMTYELPHGSLGTRARYLVIGSKAILDIAAYG